MSGGGIAEEDNRVEHGCGVQMRAWKIAPDAILYNAIIDALWETGVIWAQRKVHSAHSEPCCKALCSPDII